MYFAEIDSNNVVLRVIVADQDFINKMPGRWVETDYNGVSPKNYAGVGHTWRNDLNGFVAPQPYPSWTLNNSTCKWEAPVPMPAPQNGKLYYWDEPSLSWKQIGI